MRSRECEAGIQKHRFQSLPMLMFFVKKYSSEIREIQINVKAQLLRVKPAITLSVQFGVNGANGVSV